MPAEDSVAISERYNTQRRGMNQVRLRVDTHNYNR